MMIPSAEMQLLDMFVFLSENLSPEHGHTYFTYSMSTLERVFIELVMCRLMLNKKEL
jgi:hypothetical protein